MTSKTRVPAVEGWFTMTDEPALLASRGTQTGSYFFPKAIATSANPYHPFEDRVDVELSRRGRVWSYSTNHYQPPAPYVSPDPFVPYTVLRWNSRSSGSWCSASWRRATTRRTSPSAPRSNSSSGCSTRTTSTST